MVLCVLILEIILRFKTQFAKIGLFWQNGSLRHKWKDIFKILTLLEISLIFNRGLFFAFMILDPKSHHIGPILVTRLKINSNFHIDQCMIWAFIYIIFWLLLLLKIRFSNLTLILHKLDIYCISCIRLLLCSLWASVHA